MVPAHERDGVNDEIALAQDACPRFDLEAFRGGHLTPVYFGSALRNFGVRDLIDGLAAYAPPPTRHAAATRVVEADEPHMSGFVFKIQANMDPNHRDRIAFMRVCSGKLQRGMRAKLVRTGKSLPLAAPQFFFAHDCSIAEEAFAGDVVGIPNHGTLRIGDTLTEGEDLMFRGLPSFAPEILRRVRLEEPSKGKKLRESLQQMAEEGVVQIFFPEDGAPPIVGVVGALQLDVLRARLLSEYGIPTGFESTRYDVCRWVSAEDATALDQFHRAFSSDIAQDLDGDLVFFASSAFSLRYEQERWPNIRFTDVKDGNATVRM
jgi:peptide chain release factor 3